jgi:hypothetical protein
LTNKNCSYIVRITIIGFNDKTGTPFDAFAEDWVCPCGAPKSMFEEEGAAYKEHGVR